MNSEYQTPHPDPLVSFQAYAKAHLRVCFAYTHMRILLYAHAYLSII